MKEISVSEQQLLDEFEARTDEWIYSDFEKELQKRTGGSYHAAKLLIRAVADDNRYPKTVTRYVLTNYKSAGSSPVELKKICNSLLESLSDQEKKKFGI